MEKSRAYAINLGIDFLTFQNFKKSFSQLRKDKDGKIPKFAEEIGKSR